MACAARPGRTFWAGVRQRLSTGARQSVRVGSERIAVGERNGPGRRRCDRSRRHTPRPGSASTSALVRAALCGALACPDEPRLLTRFKGVAHHRSLAVVHLRLLVLIQQECSQDRLQDRFQERSKKRSRSVRWGRRPGLIYRPASTLISLLHSTRQRWQKRCGPIQTADAGPPARPPRAQPYTRERLVNDRGRRRAGCPGRKRSARRLARVQGQDAAKRPGTMLGTWPDKGSRHLLESRRPKRVRNGPEIMHERLPGTELSQVLGKGIGNVPRNAPANMPANVPRNRPRNRPRNVPG